MRSIQVFWIIYLAIGASEVSGIIQYISFFRFCYLLLDGAAMTPSCLRMPFIKRPYIDFPSLCFHVRLIT